MKSFKKNQSDNQETDSQVTPPASEPSSPKKSKKNLKVASLLILALLLIGGAAFAGYKKGESDAKKDAPAPMETSSVPKDTSATEPEPEMVSPESDEYEVELPSDWVSGTCEDNPSILFLAPNAGLLGKCQTESFGMVSVSSNSGDLRRTEEYYAADDYYRSPAFSSETIDGLSGYRVSYSIATESELGYPPVGTFEYFYTLYDPTDNKSYQIAYRELPGDPDHQATFIQIAESFNKL